MFINETEIHYLKKKDSQLLVSSIKNIKHKVIILLLLDGGLRVSEAISLQLQDFDFRKRSLTVKTLKKRANTKKRDKYRLIPLSGRLYQALADYLYKFKLDSDGFLFPSKHSATGYISRFSVNKFLNKHRKALNITNLHPHTLRHTCATAQLSNGADLVEIKQMLGHTSLNTTTIYTHIPEEVLRNNIERASSEDMGLWYRMKEKLFKTQVNKLITIPTKNNLPAIGRTKEIEKITSYTSRDINTIILGDIGTGKSHLLKMIEPDDKKVLKLDDLDNIKRSLIFMLIYLYQNDKELVANLLYGEFDLQAMKTKLNRDSISNLTAEIKKLVEPKEYVLIIDSVDRITARSIKALEELKDTFTIITTAREIPINKGSFLWNFEIINLKPLERKYALDLIHKLSYDLDVEDYELFRNHIFEQSNGNPRVIFEIIERYIKEPVITSNVVREIRHFGSLKELDMSLMIVIFLASLAILRYLSREIDNDSYRLIGGVAMILLLISRQFMRFTKRKVI